MLKAKTYFVTGTDTEVGKTRVACGLARGFLELGYKTIGLKPVETGCAVRPGLDEDGVLLAQATGQPRPRCAISRFRAPVAPPAAAELEDAELNFDTLVAETKAHLPPGVIGVVEGAGGLLSPVTWERTNLDLIQALGADVIVVAADKLGTLNHTLMTVRILQNAGITARCIVMSDVCGDGSMINTAGMRPTASPVDQSHGTNYDSLGRIPNIPSVARLPFVKSLEEAADALRPLAKTLLETS
jgi:dethiobiotin synthetase